MAESHHGSTPAAWTAVTLCLIAFCVGAVGLVIGNWVVFWIGIALVVVAGVVGKVMQAMGLGARGPAPTGPDQVGRDTLAVL